MNDLFKKILSIAGYLFAALLLVFTGMQTYALLMQVSGNQITAIVGLILFEAGMIYWWSVFRREAEGLFQMSIAGIMFLVSLVFVATAVSLHLGAVNADFLGPSTPARVIIIAALLNLIAKLVYPLVAPELMDQITDRAETGKVIAKAQKLYSKKIDDIADELANEMAEMRKDRARGQIYSSFTTDLNRRLPAPSADPGRVDVLPLAHPNGRIHDHEA